jgi:hypothetical protein
MAHFRWFEHGSATVLGELAATHELFLLTKCDSNPLSSIATKIKVTREDGVGVVEGKFGKDSYFYRLHYDDVARKFTTASFPEVQSSQPSISNFCDCCIQRKSAADYDSIRIEEGKNGRIKSVLRKGVSYDRLDFVYIYEEHPIYNWSNHEVLPRQGWQQKHKIENRRL